MITKAAYDIHSFTNNLIFTKSARDAWGLVIESIKQEQGYANILLPSYIGITEREGSGIFDPVQHFKANFSFYNMNENLGVDLESLEELVLTGDFNILLIVHYFGFCKNDLSKIRKICDKNDIVLVEDCAHAFQLYLDKEVLGTIGDYSIYSMHKHLAVETGGILRTNTGKIKLLAPADEIMISLEPAIQLLNTDLQAVTERRVSNFCLYKERLASTPGIHVMYELDEWEIPQTFPILVLNKLREPLYFHLMEREMPTIALYYRLLDELGGDKYPYVHDISDSILNLPVHQDVNEEDIIKLTDEIKKFLQVKR